MMSKGTTVKGDVSKKVENAGTSGNRKTVMKDNIEGKDDGQILINCIKNCAFFQFSVGAKEARFREIGKEKLDLSKEKEKLNLEQRDLCEKIAVLEEKSPDFSLEQFREVSFLKYELSQKLKDMEFVNKKVAQLTRESDRIRNQIFDGAKMYKSYIFKREELLHKNFKK